ncbi:hypothetical protein LFREDSHE_12310 [Shewanella baltica]
MRKPKKRKEKLSIYLVKSGIECDVSKAINLENSKPPIEMEMQGLDATLYVKKSPRSHHLHGQSSSQSIRIYQRIYLEVEKLSGLR